MVHLDPDERARIVRGALLGAALGALLLVLGRPRGH